MTRSRLIPVAASLLIILLWITPSADAARSVSDLIVQAERAIANKDDRAAEAFISGVPSGSLNPMQLARVQIVRARVGLQRGLPEAALRALPQTSTHVPALTSTIELLRARAQFASGDAVAAVRSLVDREHALTSAAEIENNREVIWSGLIATPLSRARVPNLAREPMARGWLELAVVLQEGPTEASIATWSRSNPNHPAEGRARLVETGQESSTVGFSSPHSQPSNAGGLSRGYALLVPVTGPLAAVGGAVRDGFISAWFDLPEPRPPLRIYDTGSEPSQSVRAFQQALTGGGDFIVGPISRENVVAISQSMQWSIPWLALNYLDQMRPGIMQFGLSPVDEAHAAARDAIAQGFRTALILAPANDWGNRAADAFAQVFSIEGGRILGSERYTPDGRDLSDPISNLLSIRRSEQRHRELTQILGSRSEFEPQPRNDVEVLFAPLRAREAHTLLPKLDFFRASEINTYMLSAAHNGNIGSQLEGVRLCDMPWVTHQSGHWASLRGRAEQAFPETLRSQPRLFALGGDALRLATALRSRGLEGRNLDAASGRLSLVGGRVQRAIDCTTVQAGNLQ